MSDVLIRISPEEYKAQLRAVRTLAGVREWAEKTEYLGYADDYSHGLVKAQLEILAILDGRNGV